jgi:hypothetical protein
MCIFGALLGSIVLVTLGYLALWTSSHENTAKGLAGFGRVMAIILFVFAVLVILCGAMCTFSPCGRSMMMRHCMKMQMHEGCGMEAMPMHHEPGMMEKKEMIPPKPAEMKKSDMKEMKNK